MIRLHGIGHDVFAMVEGLNPRFDAGEPKIRITVDMEPEPGAPEDTIVARLLTGFPGLARHECRAQSNVPLRPAGGTRLLMAEGETTANQAHVLEHLVIELLAIFEPRVRRSGVTCAWISPPERNDVYIECRNFATGAAATSLAMVALEHALQDRPLTPLFADLVRVWSVVAGSGAFPVSPKQVVCRSGLPSPRVERALSMLADHRLLEREDFAVNLSGETHFRTP